MARINNEDVESSEKAALLPTQPETGRTYPEKHAINRRRWFPGALIAFVIFVWWSSSAIPSLVGLGRHEIYEDMRQLDFEDV
ncbi:uncharacterized protein BP5553_07371 [Venustampulla echinocandica]|uniref:Uncharacterized protein n=1 Tax=Venustampulla echinocandica TaxID=2656787 RepID=A0A370TJB9_9HELO|nr:uncharacterized protein BP5553_07371 [Venustampulla echinocandica]RDL35440.1 hypothetical protein BP5553_07371 [Venustampulla echinocandica]